MDPTETDGPVWCTKDEEFWYEDGDVILLVNATALKVHGPRLASYCGYFHELFGLGNHIGVISAGEAEGCSVYPVTPELSLEDFKNLLRVIESPFEHTTNPPSQQVAVSLLLAAHTLSCGYVLDLAKKRLCEIWDRRTLPTTDRSDSEDRNIDAAVRAIKLGRQFGIPGVLKRAFYEILSSVANSEEDVHRLLAARLKLGRLWRKFVVEPPSGAWCVTEDGSGSTRRCCHAGDSKETREGKWRNFVCERDLLDVADPVRYDLTKGLRIVDGMKAWCEGCLESKRRAWEVMRVEWWNEMDEWFGL